MLHRASSPIGFALPEGTRRTNADGYVQVKMGGQWVMEHRHVTEGIIGRSLAAHERVHHKNGRRDDNRPENLELWRIKGKDPAGVRAADYHCPGCRCEELGEMVHLSVTDAPDEFGSDDIDLWSPQPVAVKLERAEELLRLYRPDLLT